MSNLTKLIIPTLILIGIYLAFIFAPSEEIGSFDKVRAAGEINQNVYVKVATSRGIELQPVGFEVVDPHGCTKSRVRPDSEIYL